MHLGLDAPEPGQVGVRDVRDPHARDSRLLAVPAGSRYTIVSFHAHPDDEALLTSGTLARAAAEGHRVVLVSATAGEVGLAASSFGTADELAGHRRAELQRSAAAIGAARVEFLGYADSGLDGRAEPAGRGHGVRPGRRRRGGRAAGGDPARGARRRADELRRLGRVRTPRSRAGPPRRRARRRARRDAGRARGHRRPGPAAPGGPAGVAGLPLPAGVRPRGVRARVRPACRAHPPGRRPGLRRPQAGLDGGAREPGHRRHRGPHARGAAAPAAAAVPAGARAASGSSSRGGRRAGRCSTTSSRACGGPFRATTAPVRDGAHPPFGPKAVRPVALRT